MEWTIPGTAIRGSRADVEGCIRQIEGMFLGGGMIRSQLASVSGVEAHDIQNWVKRGFLSNPVNKRYSIQQFSRIVTINMLRSAMTMDKICSLLTYVNGELDELEPMMDAAAERLNVGGRLAVITFHSLEDRLIKKAMQRLATGCTCPPEFPVCVCGKQPKMKLVTRKPVVSTVAELEYNPRARSAKLRVAEKI
jgi:hypothetical protein